MRPAPGFSSRRYLSKTIQTLKLDRRYSQSVGFFHKGFHDRCGHGIEDMAFKQKLKEQFSI